MGELEKLKNNNTQIPEFTIKEVPFSWNDNFSEIALEDFSMIQKNCLRTESGPWAIFCM